MSLELNMVKHVCCQNLNDGSHLKIIELVAENTSFVNLPQVCGKLDCKCDTGKTGVKKKKTKNLWVKPFFSTSFAI